MNTGVDCHSLLQGIFPTQGSNLGIQHCTQMIYQLSYEGSPFLLVVVSIFALFIFSLFCYVHDGSWLFDIILIGSSFQQYETYLFILFAVNIAFPVSILWDFLDTHLHIFPFVFNASISFICVSFWKNTWNWIFKQSVWEFNSFTSIMIADIFRAIYIMPLCIFYLSCFSFGLCLFFCLLVIWAIFIWFYFF